MGAVLSLLYCHYCAVTTVMVDWDE